MWSNVISTGADGNCKLRHHDHFSKPDQERAGPYHSPQSIAHDATIHCGDNYVRFKTVAICQRDLWQIASNDNV